MTTRQHPPRTHDRARWVVAASLLAHDFSSVNDDETMAPPVTLVGCKGRLTTATSSDPIPCDVNSVTHDGVTISLRAVAAPADPLELEWDASLRIAGRHRFMVLDAEETGPGEWSLRLRWIGFSRDVD